MEQVRMEFAEFYRSSRDNCLRTVLAIIGDKYLAEDLVAEGFARALTRWDKVSRHPAPEAWVVRAGLNARVSWWRKNRREVPLPPHHEGLPVPAAEDGIDASLLDAVRLLPRRQREVLALRIFLDLDTQQTARTLGVSPNTVSVHLFRAVAQLRERLSVNPTEVYR